MDFIRILILFFNNLIKKIKSFNVLNDYYAINNLLNKKNFYIIW